MQFDAALVWSLCWELWHCLKIKLYENQKSKIWLPFLQRTNEKTHMKSALVLFKCYSVPVGGKKVLISRTAFLKSIKWNHLSFILNQHTSGRWSRKKDEICLKKNKRKGVCGGGDGPQPPRHQPHNCQQLISRQCGDSHSQPEDWKIQPCLCDGGTDLILQVSHHTSTASLPMPSAWKQASALKGQPKFPCQFDVPNTFEEFKTRSCLTLNCKENTSKIYPEYPDKKGDILFSMQLLLYMYVLCALRLGIL